MKVFKFLVALSLMLATFWFLHFPQGSIPPLGKLLSPHQGYLQNGETNVIGLPEKLSLEGLKSTVKVRFDSELIPFIEAENDEDLFFVQGYITAYHRLWQMEMQLYKTAGRISELLGPNFVNFDKMQRRKGLVYGANRALTELQKDEEIYGFVQAYTAGVNAYINSLSPAKYPIEYKLLNYAPEPWTPFKTCLLLKEMSDQLSRGEADLQNTNALQLFGKDLFDLLYPEKHPSIDPVIPRGTKWTFDPIKVAKPAVSFPLEFTNSHIEAPDPRNGSNNFVVNGIKTGDGSVILANEPDLGLNQPSIWYVVHLKSPNRNVMGASLPGAPMVIIGFNDSIAWGLTNAKRDLVDWYFIEFNDDSRSEYKYDDKLLKTEKVVETIKVKGGKSIYDTIVYTHYGPVTYDRNLPLNDNKNLNLAMRWTAHDPSKEMRAINQLNTARNHREFVAAFDYYTGPPQNFAFASVTGDIAMMINGRFPVKWKEQGKFLLDGRLSSHEWQTFMPVSHHYQVKNPPQNFVSSANQHPGDSTYPYYDFDYNWEFYRNRRINDRLKVMSKVTVKDMMKLQNDNFHYHAFETLPVFYQYLDTTRLSATQYDYLNQLKEWDYFAEPDRKAPAVFELWWMMTYKLTWDEFSAQKISLYRPTKYNTWYLMSKYPEFEFFDKKQTPEKETLADLINEGFGMAIDSLENWRKANGDDYSWYIFKNTTITHLLQLKPFSFEKVRIGGNDGIVNAASGKHGPSWRMVVRFADGKIDAYGVYPGSQTGNPGHIWYGHQIEKWAAGEYYPLNFYDIPADKVLFSMTLSSSN